MSSYPRSRDSTLPRPATSAPRHPSTLQVPPDAIARLVRAGQHLCWSGDPIHELWAVQRGALKAYEISFGGAERVSGFFFPGDVIGWEALACGSFHTSTIALERTLVTPLSATALLDGALGSSQRQGLLPDGIRSEFIRLRARFGFEQRPAGSGSPPFCFGWPNVRAARATATIPSGCRCRARTSAAIWGWPRRPSRVA